MSSERARWPVSRVLVFVAVVGPALWLGGVPAVVLPAFLAVVALLWLRQGRGDRERSMPAGAWVFAMLGVVTALQLVPLPDALLARLAPGTHALLERALVDTPIASWSRISVVPDSTALELGRVLGLGLLFVAAAQLSWRVSAGAVVACGTLVAALGLVHEAMGLEQIYGLYTPRMRQPGDTASVLTSFVNPNHQAGLFLLGSFTAAGLAQDLYLRADEASDPERAQRLRDRCLAMLAAFAAMLAALMLSLSRSALLVLAVVAPVALVLAIRERRQSPARRKLSRAGLVLAAVPFVLLVVAAAMRGVTPQLGSLGDPGSYSVKARVIRESLQLIGFAPVLGIGRGSFVDLFPVVDSDPGPLVFTHLESTPVMALVEWGPLAGGAALIGVAWWWIRSFRATQSTAKRLVLLGILAVGAQSVADFSLEFLGVAAPAVALAGSLSPRGREISRRIWIGSGLALIVAASIGAWFGQGAGWAARLEADASMSTDAARAALGERPLDGRLHLRLARDAFAEGDWAQAWTRATVATELLPASADAWLVRSAAAEALGELEAADRATAQALARLVVVPPPESVAYLIARYADAEALAALAPEAEEPWRLLEDALLEHAPVHALSLARHRLDAIGDLLAMEYGFRAAMRLQNPALALHYARLASALEPDRAHVHLWRVEALLGFAEPRDGEAIAGLEAALTHDLDDRGLVEERLLGLLLHRDDDVSRERAVEVADDLLTRDAPRKIKARREQMAKWARERR